MGSTDEEHEKPTSPGGKHNQNDMPKQEERYPLRSG